MEINWSKYLDLYPDRYIKESKINKQIKRLLFEKDGHSSSVTQVLDIGGNKEGTLPISYFLTLKLLYIV